MLVACISQEFKHKVLQSDRLNYLLNYSFIKSTVFMFFDLNLMSANNVRDYAC